MHILVHGVLLESQRLPWAPDGFFSVVEPSAPKLNVSRTRLLRDEKNYDVLRAARRSALRAVEAVCQRLSSPARALGNHRSQLEPENAGRAVLDLEIRERSRFSTSVF